MDLALSVTRYDKIGSLEATYFEFSDAKPVANETISVTAAIENVGLIDAEGYSIHAVIREKADEGYYADVKSYFETFIAAPEYSITVDEAVQDGDQFRVKYSVTNRGNAPAAEGTSVGIRLVGLYNDLKTATAT